MPAFRTGADEAREASKSTSFAKTHYLSIEDGKQEIVRFLTDADSWITVDRHNFVPTRSAPPGHQGNWPTRMSAVCRRDPAFADEPGYDGTCYICDNVTFKDKNGKTQKATPSGRTYALAVLREEVIEDGKRVGWRDKVREVEDSDGTKRKERAVVVVNQGWKNFFSTLDGYAGLYTTIVDRDYLIKRSGGGTDTDYAIIPLDPIVVPDPDDSDKEIRYDIRDPRIAERYSLSDSGRVSGEVSVADVVVGQSSEEFYARFFDVTKPHPTREGDDGAPQAEKPSNDVDEAQLAALRDRVRSYGGEVGTPTPTA